jgi:hypothetical protein
MASRYDPTSARRARAAKTRRKAIRSLLSHPFSEWFIMILAVMAGFVAMKFLVSYVPDGGVLGAVKNVIMAA